MTQERPFPIVFNISVFVKVLSNPANAGSEQQLRGFIIQCGGTNADYENIASALRTVGICKQTDPLELRRIAFLPTEEQRLQRITDSLYGVVAPISTMHHLERYFSNAETLNEVRARISEKYTYNPDEVLQIVELLRVLNDEIWIARNRRKKKEARESFLFKILGWGIVIIALLILGTCLPKRNYECEYGHAIVCTPT